MVGIDGAGLSVVIIGPSQMLSWCPEVSDLIVAPSRLLRASGPLAQTDTTPEYRRVE